MISKLNEKINSLFALRESSLEILLSKSRIGAFGGKEKYKEHLDFTQGIFPSLQIIEVLLRNKIDLSFKNAIILSSPQVWSNEWILDFYAFNFKSLLIQDKIKIQIERLQEKIFQELKSLEDKLGFKPNPTFTTRQSWIHFLHHTKKRQEIHSWLISKMSLGFWIEILRLHFFIQKTTHLKLELSKNIFQNLFTTFSSPQNQELYCKFFDEICHSNINKLFLDQRSCANRVIIFVSMIKAIRNRVAHCENLLKDSTKPSSIKLCFGKYDFYLKATKENIVEYLSLLLKDLRVV